MAYNSAYTGAQVDAAVGAVRNKETTWDSKQNALSGTEDQLVGFNEAGEAVPVGKPTAEDVGAIPTPAGGQTGQVLTKTATGEQWDDVPSDLPAGGTNGQILTKTANGVAWSDAPDTGVTTFNGRTGTVTPQSGDYTADMVGARPNTWTPSAADVGALTQTQGDGRYIVLPGGGTAQMDAGLGSGPFTIEFDKESDEADNNILTFGSQSVSNWAEDSTYDGYGFRAPILLSGVTANYVPSVTFGIADATSGNLAPVADSYAGGVYIYAKEQPDAAVSVLSVVCVKGA